jgi:hypothetical protein
LLCPGRCGGADLVQSRSSGRAGAAHRGRAGLRRTGGRSRAEGTGCEPLALEGIGGKRHATPPSRLHLVPGKREAARPKAPGEITARCCSTRSSRGRMHNDLIVTRCPEGRRSTKAIKIRKAGPVRLASDSRVLACRGRAWKRTTGWRCRSASRGNEADSALGEFLLSSRFSCVGRKAANRNADLYFWHWRDSRRGSTAR